MGGDDEHGEIGRIPRGCARAVQAAHIRQADIDDGDGEGGRGEVLERLPAGVAEHGVVAEAAAEGAEGGGESGLVFDDEEA